MNARFLDLLHQLDARPTKLLHVGANNGQEVPFYASHGIETWHVEAIPSAFEHLKARCSGHPSQHAINACLSNEDGKSVVFHLASNDYQSSSLLPLGRHSTAYPQVVYTDEIALVSSTIDVLVESQLIPGDIDFIVIDVQGAELLVLEGARKLLSNPSMRGCQVETAVVPLYESGASYLEVAHFLRVQNLYLRTCDFNNEGWADSLFLRPYWPRTLAAKDLQAVEVMRPKPSPKPLIRVGGDTDGAYLIPNDLSGIKACYSPGVCNTKDFEDDLLIRFGISCHMCDFSSDAHKFKTALLPGQTFKKKWLEPASREDSISLQDWVNELSPNSRDDLMLQMDIEGAEYRNLLNTPRHILKRFRIIVVELHRLGVCKQPEIFGQELGALLERLDEDFLCVHAHPNNCCGDFVLPGTLLNIPNVHELTFLRRDRWGGIRAEDCFAPHLPHPLDIAANVAAMPPLSLNPHWLHGGRRSPESQEKLERDEKFFRETTSRAPDSLPPRLKTAERIFQQFHHLAQHASLELPDLLPRPPKAKLIDLAHGKRFQLSSSYNGSALSGFITETKPFFFHTDKGTNQHLTIDLAEACVLFQLSLRNRSDTCKERARSLFYIIHNTPHPDFTKGFAVNTAPLFTSEDDYTSITNLRGCTGRYFTLYSPEDTYLHLSLIQLWGLP